jgi:hypothetical protein
VPRTSPAPHYLKYEVSVLLIKTYVDYQVKEGRNLTHTPSEVGGILHLLIGRRSLLFSKRDVHDYKV